MPGIVGDSTRGKAMMEQKEGDGKRDNGGARGSGL